jgi:hypothetical protein
MLRRLLLIALAAGATTCSVPGPSVAFSAICAPPDDAVKCSFAATCGAQILGNPAVDVAVTNQLVLIVEVHNQALDNHDDALGRANGHDAYFQEIDVSYSGGALGIPDVKVRTQNVVPAAGTSTVYVNAIPAAAGLAPGSLPAGTRTTVIAKIKGKGVFGDGSSFETQEWEIPVILCNGCLGIPTCSDPTQSVVGVCPQGGQVPASVTCQ